MELTQASELSVEEGRDAGAGQIFLRPVRFAGLICVSGIRRLVEILGRGWCPRHRPLPFKESLRKWSCSGVSQSPST